ncbi:MAG: hypothetical protein RL565_103 [Pseudomonadota bacterium]
MRNSSLIQFIHHKYDLITPLHVGSSLLSLLSPIYRQFGLWARYMGDASSRQDHLNFYKWLSFEFARPIFDIPTQNRAQIPDLGNFSPISSLRVG